MKTTCDSAKSEANQRKHGVSLPLAEAVVFTQRGETFPVISLRKANNREIDSDEQATQIDP
ncbi:BrnT family toxin [Paraburkholderia acidipaludis]|uniref:BrnT family toxin n=1 Tax=Paraburkholderia acidipaludis TaxID=660537 RepID=UPI000AA8A3E3|nr:BrnT family toxin [Paraburkholderia acidipaludis]